MDSSTQYLPIRRPGLLFHAGLLAGLAALGGACFWFSVQQSVGLYFVLLQAVGLILIAPVPFLAYRFYALMQAEYVLSRDGLHLHWGLRSEDIPLNDIEWLRPAAELGFGLPLPWLRMPGALLGVRHVEGLGTVEFVASSRRNLLLLATPQRVYAISPADATGFAGTFRSAIEMGSLQPIQAASSRPAVFLRRAWDERAVRVLLLSGALLTLVVFIISGMVIPNHTTISLGYAGSGRPQPGGPPEQLLLLPVLGILCYAFDVIAGLFLYRRQEQHPVAYLLWGSSILTSLLLLAGVLLAR